MRQWQLPITSAYQEQTIRWRPVTTVSPTSTDLCTGPIPLSACRSIDNDIVRSNSLEQRLIKPHPHIPCIQLIILTTKARNRRRKGERILFPASLRDMISDFQIFIKYVHKHSCFKTYTVLFYRFCLIFVFILLEK